MLPSACCTVTSSQLLFVTIGEPLVMVRTFHTSAKGISSETDWVRFLLRRATGRVLRDTDVTGLGGWPVRYGQVWSGA